MPASIPVPACPRGVYNTLCSCTFANGLARESSRRGARLQMATRLSAPRVMRRREEVGSPRGCSAPGGASAMDTTAPSCAFCTIAGVTSFTPPAPPCCIRGSHSAKLPSPLPVSSLSPPLAEPPHKGSMHVGPTLRPVSRIMSLFVPSCTQRMTPSEQPTQATGALSGCASRRIAIAVGDLASRATRGMSMERPLTKSNITAFCSHTAIKIRVPFITGDMDLGSWVGALTPLIPACLAASQYSDSMSQKTRDLTEPVGVLLT
mmetsp:Transcript_11903/g.21465  ORF Transcript_11903/g.21465 Transcript_11903/m.21465 type:complete len:262 (+) Transcript_11903:282-1067(+)